MKISKVVEDLSQLQQQIGDVEIEVSYKILLRIDTPQTPSPSGTSARELINRWWEEKRISTRVRNPLMQATRPHGKYEKQNGEWQRIGEHPGPLQGRSAEYLVELIENDELYIRNIGPKGRKELHDAIQQG